MKRLIPGFAAVLSISLPSAGFAQDTVLTERFALDGFVAGTPTAAVLGVPTAEVPPHLGAELGATLHYMRRPLVAALQVDGEESFVGIVDGRWTTELGFTFGLFERLSLEVSAPVIVSQSGAGLSTDPRASEGDDLNSFAVGDLSVASRALLVESGIVRLGLGGRLWLPTGADVAFVSDGIIRGMPFVVADAHAGPVLAGLQVGYAIRGNRRAHNFRSDDAITWGLAMRWRIAAVTAEASIRGAVSPFEGFAVPGTATTRLPYPVEALGGLAWNVGDFRVGAAAGPGLNNAVGAPRWRALFTVAYALDPHPVVDDVALAKSDAATGFATVDGASGSAGPADGATDDEDGDGVLGLDDMCPTEVGTVENQGCAPEDSDGDGLNDSVDACPMDKEDIDQFEDEDGCPDPDNDGDGFADVDDKCPNEAEVVNGKLDDDGCPDEVSAEIEVTKDRIEVRESIYFDSDRATIKQRSLAVLRRVAKVLSDHPEVKKLSIEGHTDSRGSAKHNLELSARRAEAVRLFLISEGIDQGRLQATGYGESHPVASNETDDGRTKNRRVEFLISARED